MTDQEIVDGLINRDEKITDWFFNIKYRPLFINVIIQLLLPKVNDMIKFI